jgi:hypothetical protein
VPWPDRDGNANVTPVSLFTRSTGPDVFASEEKPRIFRPDGVKSTNLIRCILPMTPVSYTRPNSSLPDSTINMGM